MHRLEKELYERIKCDPALFEFVQESSLDGIWFWDLENPEEEWMSDKLWRTLGYDPDTKTHKASEWQSIINQDDLAKAIDNFNQHAEEPTHPYDQIVRYQHADGSTVWIRCRGMILRNAQGQPIRMLGAHTDVTKLKESEQQAIDALRARDRFFARMSHEIRTPLFGMLGVAESLKNSLQDPDILRDVDTILECGEQLQSLLNDILTLTKLEAGKLTTSLEIVSLQQVFLHLQRLYDGKAKEKGLTLEVAQADCQTLFCKTDKVRLTQILSNLLSNAIKYTKQGKVSLDASYHDGQCKLIVQDTGVGIKDIAAVCEPYSQERHTDLTGIGSTGLGLDVVIQLCDMLGYEFSLQSEVNTGTTASIGLAAQQDLSQQRSTTEQQPHDPESTVQLGNVLVVDDNAINLIVANRMLEGHCVLLDNAQNGIEALNKLKSGTHYDIVLLDINMPGMSGYDVLKQLTELRLPATPKIVMLSADAYEATRVTCIEMGAHDYLVKPYSKSQLFCVLNRSTAFASC
ncbi:PAS domain-containing hybrid sensor histidine kinase/response regulator [Pseudoalteromonas sp. OOF1S-7]|uniref:hybrid sensor histidine kinase/response regulator n=1 Tax=Pseudoalteromonas sp. OOF1S-7 TaxID=2917757 RepID=UPI001EF4F2BA|nr:PAS domain-containing hybrid sensor histidine kinase/response regulator [Pseudoalteromonas sp. OOF1S-7]MCG7536559.1 response regulator [Pseudoalteromonas sp. OOF1S-7]